MCSCAMLKGPNKRRDLIVVWRRIELPEQLLQIMPVGVLAEHLGPCRQLLARNPAMAIGNLVRAAGLQTLALLKRSHEIAGIKQARMRPCIEPGIAASHQTHLQ